MPLPLWGWWLTPMASSCSIFASALADDLPNLPPAWQWGSAVGVLAMAVGAFLRGWIIPGSTHERELREKDKRITALETANQSKDVQLREQSEFMRDQLMPLTTRTQDVLTKLLEERAWDERMQRRRQQD